MLEYQSRIESLLHEISSKFTHSAAFEELEKKFHMDKIFEHKPANCSFCDPADARIRKESVLIAAWLIHEKFKNIDDVLKKIEMNRFHLSTEFEVDNLFYGHAFHSLSKIKNNKKLLKRILQFSVPIFNPWSEKIIRLGLRLSPREKITPEHIQTLVLSAFLHPLRQNVGSCFATAPAIIIQKEQPEQFFDDLESLLNIGLLKRTFSGHEHAVPISTSWGPGIMNKVIEVSLEDKLWESAELVYCLKELQVLGKKESDHVNHDALRKILSEKLKLNKGRKISLHELIRKILLIHYNLTEKELSGQSRKESITNMLGQDRYGIAQPLSRRRQFEEAFSKAQYYLISFHENPLLKTWEYTFASFGETQSQFYKWNLYTSIGFDSKKEYSIAHCIYQYLEKKMKSYEEKIQFHNNEYEQEYFRVKMLEKRVVDTENEHTASWARVEFQNHLNEFNFHKKMRDSFVDKSERLSHLLSKILKTYDQLFPQYFQEVYDASMQEMSSDIFQDSPAGFRLIYKHGRQDPSLWSFVESKEDFIAYLKEFFVNTEFEISAQEGLEEFKEEYSEIITSLVHLIHSEDFILSAFKRIGDRYQIPFPAHNLSKLEDWPYKPWCYISGGTMERLLAHYYKRETQFTKVEQRVASVTELFAFLVDTIRSFTPDQVSAYQSNLDRSLLMYSPNHAFLLKPGWTSINKIWDSKEYSFSWVRDEVVHPQLRFIEKIKLNPLEINYFLNAYLSKHPYFSLWLKENIQWPSYEISIKDFRDLIHKCFTKVPQNLSDISINLELIDSWIYQCFPLVQGNDLQVACQNCVKRIFKESSDLEKAEWVIPYVLKLYKKNLFIQAHELYEIIKIVLSIVYEKVAFQKDWPRVILKVLREEKLMMPKPFVFADSNWPHFNFAFTVNPATEQLELWRMNALANKGFPMHQWANWFSEKQVSSWGVLTQFNEYLP
ncbi:MAG: hypothetical protein S4CHLAM6_11200 [Chlamydiae bacterium]|nr:hypothetical protein [Chlamydiota bacterium]